MPLNDAQSLLHLAMQRHQAGELKEAERLYRQILSQTNNPDAMHMLGVLAHQVGKSEIAIDLISRAIASNPNVAIYHCNLGLALNASSRYSQASASLAESVRLDPTLAEAHNNLGIALWHLGEPDLAVQAWREAVRLQPAMAEAYGSLGIALQRQGKFDEAIAALTFAIQLRPDSAEYHDHLGTALWSQGAISKSLSEYRRAIELQPGEARFHNHLGSALWASGKLDEAIQSIQTAIQLNPILAEAYSNLGNTLKDQGKLEDAIAAYRRAIELKPNDPAIHSSLIYLLHFHPANDLELIRVELNRWKSLHADPLKSEIRIHENNRDPDRKLRIGYISPDFREHAVGRCILPLLKRHDHQNFEIFCYSDSTVLDGVSKQIEAQADHWRPIVGQSDEAATKIIRNDRIDLLVDLAAHTPGNRLLVFARKTAPVQLTYLSYPSTTGLDTIDYRITDPYLDPRDRTQPLYSEQSLYMSDAYWCYEAQTTPEVNALPALQAGFVTFGCLNAFRKVSADAMRTWSAILRKVQESRLMLFVGQGSQRNDVKKLFHDEGVDPGRLTFVEYAPLANYFQSYHKIDIALDPFPYTGGTTTCDALWMGVPVVSLAGKIAFHRGGVTLLNNMGLCDLIAMDHQQYVDVAVGLAKNQSTLAGLRSTLRQRMERSTLMDAARFADNMEQAYRSVWRRWCAAPQT